MGFHEKWAPVIGFDGYYEASNRGRVRRVAPGRNTYVGRILSTSRDARGKPFVILCRPGQRRTLELHKVVWEAHRGEVPTGYFVAHKDGDVSDCQLYNLELRPLKGEHRHWREFQLSDRDRIELLAERLDGRSFSSLVVRWGIPLYTLKKELRAALFVSESTKNAARWRDGHEKG